MSDGIAGGQVVGIDLHLHRSVICRIDDHGEELGWVRIDNDPAALVGQCRKAGRGVPVAIEATYGWYWAVDALLAAGSEVHLAHPLGMKALRKRKRVKTDPRDAYELANLLRLGSLPEAYIAPPDLRELRELVRHRRQLVKLATSIKGGVRALLAKHNIRLAASDLDGDGASNLAEFRAGTQPNNSNSVFRIVNVQPQLASVLLTWTTVGGKTYFVQTNNPLPGGGISTNFADASPPIPVGGTGESMTNYAVSGGVSSAGARYYRIRLGP